MTREIEITGFRLYRMGHRELYDKKFSPSREEELISENLPVCPAAVPGCVERDLAKAGALPEDIAYGDNILRCRELERMHFFYAASFETENVEKSAEDVFLCFGGIDTVSEIYVDGVLIGKTENMLIPHEFPLDGITAGKHELLIHIIPVSVYAMRKDMPASGRALPYNLDSLCVRKAPCMFGWDIMPRAVSAGLWRPVTLSYRPASRLQDVYLEVNTLDESSAWITLRASIYTNEDSMFRFAIRVHGECEDSVFEKTARVFGSHNGVNITVPDPKIWQVRGRGKQFLYDVSVTLLFDGKPVHTVNFRTGLRTVYLDRTSLAGPDGKFRFIVNGKPVFILGTNLVPNDMFPAISDTLYEREMALVRDIGCNAVRIWGGGIYRTDAFYDLCDENGILIWHDFMMACGFYPQDEKFTSLLRTEAISVVKRLRNHPSLALWSGDNECDDSRVPKGRWNGTPGIVSDPNDNVLTRNLLPSVVADYDGTRPFLPSSPYRDRNAFGKAGHISEDHLWGPRDWFKGGFYIGQSLCHFASETGYHGCPSPESLSRFIRPEHIDKRGDSRVCDDADWLLHAANPEPYTDAAYAYRIPLMTRQVERLFGEGSSSGNVYDYALKSQISQAEAMKFFVEHFRAGKGYRSGIIWWNIIDGWAQISDAVVDYYGCKKLAYSYIKRSQAPVCLLFDEPDADGMLTLIAVNENTAPIEISYTVEDALNGTVLLSGNVKIDADGKEEAGKLHENAARFLFIRWSGDASGVNHFVTRIGDILSFEDYSGFMKRTEFDRALEGFGPVSGDKAEGKR